MARFNSDIFAKQAAGSFANRIDDKREVEGTLLWAKALITIPAGLAAADILGVVRLPDGAIVRPEHCFTLGEAPGAALVGTFGDSVDPDRYSKAVTLTAGGKIPFIPNNAVVFPDGFLTRYKVEPVKNETPLVAATKDVIFTVTTSTTPTVGAKVWVFVAYQSL